MSLRQSPIRTPALLAANRANAQKSTGPRTPLGKGRARLNSLQHGRRSRIFQRFTRMLAEFPDQLDRVRQLTLSATDEEHWRIAKLIENWPRYQPQLNYSPTPEMLERFMGKKWMRKYGAAWGRPANRTRERTGTNRNDFDENKRIRSNDSTEKRKWQREKPECALESTNVPVRSV